MKMSPATLKGWQKRFFILKDNKLKYWKNIQDCQIGKNAQGIILFDFVSAVVVKNEKTELGFDLKLNGCKRVFQFKASTQEDFNNWI